MLENIKSSYLIKNIFSYIDDEKRRLRIFKYNKSLQKLNNINLVNYKIFSGKYIIYDANGKGKIYDAYKDTLLYDGEILLGEKNGKGIEYWYFYKFEGEFVNGKRNGKGKEFFIERVPYERIEILIFEGKFLNGERNGEGKEFDIKGNLIYEGLYLNGNRLNGRGKEYYNNEYLKFEGEYLDGKRWNGKEFDLNHNYSELKDGKGLIKKRLRF